MKKIFIVTMAFLMVNIAVFGCTNFLVSRGASVDGSTMITYAADSHTLYGELYFTPAGFYPEGAMLDIYEWDTGKYLGKIKQVRETYSVVGNMNEHQVAIGETTYGGRKEFGEFIASLDKEEVKKEDPKADVTEEAYGKLKSGDKYWHGGVEYTKE